MQDKMTFGACLAAFMRGRGLSVAALTRITGTKSATTVSRLVHDQSTPKRCSAFLETLLASFHDLTAEERVLLQQGLATSHAHTEDALTRQALQDLLLTPPQEPPASPLSELLLSHTDAEQYDVYCLQCADGHILQAFDRLLRHNHQQVNIYHFAEGPIALGLPTFLSLARSFLCDPRYHLVYRSDGHPGATWRPGNLMILRTLRNHREQQFFVIPKPGGQYSMLPIDAATDMYSFLLTASREAFAGTDTVTSTWNLTTPRNSLNYLTRSYQREKGRISSLLRTRPDLCMVPLQLLRDQYTDAPTLQFTSVREYYMELRRLCFLRHSNRMEKPQATRIIFSREGLRAFMQDGLLMEHFRSLRPYTPEERRKILHHLLQQSQESSGLHLYIAKDERLFGQLHISGYDSCVQFAPIMPDFIGAGGSRPYAEAFITDNVFVRLFHDYFTQVVIPQLTYTEEESRMILRQLLEEAE